MIRATTGLSSTLSYDTLSTTQLGWFPYPTTLNRRATSIQIVVLIVTRVVGVIMIAIVVIEMVYPELAPLTFFVKSGGLFVAGYRKVSGLHPEEMWYSIS